MTVGICTNIADRIKVTEVGSALAILCYHLYECGNPPGCYRLVVRQPMVDGAAAVTREAPIRHTNANCVFDSALRPNIRIRRKVLLWISPTFGCE